MNFLSNTCLCLQTLSHHNACFSEECRNTQFIAISHNVPRNTFAATSVTQSPAEFLGEVETSQIPKSFRPCDWIKQNKFDDAWFSVTLGLMNEWTSRTQLVVARIVCRRGERIFFYKYETKLLIMWDKGEMEINRGFIYSWPNFFVQ